MTSWPPITPLDHTKHDRSHFRSGEPALDDWIGRFAGQAARRINLRVEPEADEILRAAAHAQHTSLSAFMLESALERAQQVLDAERRLVLRAEEFDRIMEELDRPGRVVTPLMGVAERASSPGPRAGAPDSPATSG